MRIGAIFFLILLSANFAYAQLENSNIRAGNKFYLDSNFVDAEVEYKKGYTKNQNSYKAEFNIADALYKQENYKGAASEFEALLGKETDPKRLSKIYFNLGNCHMQKKEYDQAEEQFKNALRQDPTDEEARYNLAYVQQILHQQQQQQQNQGGGGDNQDQNKDGDEKSDSDDSGEGKNDKDSDKKDSDDKDKKGEGDNDKNKDKKDDKKNSGDQNKDDKNKQDKQPQNSNNQGQQKQQTISREDMERMLEALKSDEKDVQEKATKEKARQQGRVRVEKDW